MLIKLRYWQTCRLSNVAEYQSTVEEKKRGENTDQNEGSQRKEVSLPARSFRIGARKTILTRQLQSRTSQLTGGPLTGLLYMDGFRIKSCQTLIGWKEHFRKFGFSWMVPGCVPLWVFKELTKPLPTMKDLMESNMDYYWYTGNKNIFRQKRNQCPSSVNNVVIPKS